MKSRINKYKSSKGYIIIHYIGILYMKGQETEPRLKDLYKIRSGKDRWAFLQNTYIL